MAYVSSGATYDLSESEVVMGWEVVAELGAIARLLGWSAIACGRTASGRLATSRS